MARISSPETLMIDENELVADGLVQHRIPVIDKMFQILELVRQEKDSATINMLAAASRVPRSTVYRILNTLAAHNAISRSGRGTYKLGFRLVGLAAAVDTSIDAEALVQLARPILIKLANDTGETSKLTFVKGGAAEVLDVVLSPNAMAPSSRVGSRFFLHAGAASKVLLAFSSPELQEEVLGGELTPVTANTITNGPRLRRELEDVRASGFAFDRGEWSVNVNAVAAPILDFSGRLVGALSVAYFADSGHSNAEKRMIGPVTDAARAASTLLGYLPDVTSTPKISAK